MSDKVYLQRPWREGTAAKRRHPPSSSRDSNTPTALNDDHHLKKSKAEINMIKTEHKQLKTVREMCLYGRKVLAVERTGAVVDVFREPGALSGVHSEHGVTALVHALQGGAHLLHRLHQCVAGTCGAVVSRRFLATTIETPNYQVLSIN